MAVIRALLRSRRLEWEQNRAVKGHELGWQALNIESPHGEDRQFRTSSHGKCSQQWKQLRRRSTDPAKTVESLAGTSMAILLFCWNQGKPLIKPSKGVPGP
jgi:hypothetical protein